MNMGQYNSEESFFNMAVAYLERIDKLLYKCQESAIGQNIDEWRNYLRALYREASVKLNDVERKEIEDKFKLVNNLANNPMSRSVRKQEILYALDLLDIHLRTKLQQKAMLLPSKSDPRYAVLNR